MSLEYSHIIPISKTKAEMHTKQFKVITDMAGFDLDPVK